MARFVWCYDRAEAINNIDNSGYPSVDFAVYGKSKYGLFNPSVEVTFFLAIRLLHDSQIPDFTILLDPSWVAIQLAC